MRHLHFTQSLEPLQGGGLGSSAVALHNQLRTAGTHSVLYSTHGGTPQRVAEFAYEFPRLQPNFAYFSPALFRNGAQLVREADVLHGHGLYVGTNWIFGREARRQSKPLVYHVQGMFEPFILQRSRWKKRLVHRLFEDANIRQVRLWRALTEKEAGQIRACGYKAPVVVAPNGLNLEHYVPPASSNAVIETPLIHQLRKPRNRMLFLSRIHPKKGLDLLLAAWSRLERERQHWELVIAGPDELGHMAQIQRLARSLGIENQVLFTGTVTGKTKSALFHSADLFVLPSYSEGMPMSLLEAMACRVPVVATRACNISDIAATGAGWECDAERDSLTVALREALTADPLERQQRGLQGRRLVENTYAWPAIANQLLQACAAHC
ncbi:MAG: glycosyltransferase [Akkermansiaceae bacterium]|nr:glycosyltransferase [Verrucomicrobiales bacterium]